MCICRLSLCNFVNEWVWKESSTLNWPYLILGTKGPYIKYVGGGARGFCVGHEIF